MLPNNSYNVVRYVKNVVNVFRGFSETVLFEKILEIYSYGLATAAFMWYLFCSQYLARVQPSGNISPLKGTKNGYNSAYDSNLFFLQHSTIFAHTITVYGECRSKCTLHGVDWKSRWTGTATVSVARYMLNCWQRVHMLVTLFVSFFFSTQSFLLTEKHSRNILHSTKKQKTNTDKVLLRVFIWGKWLIY